MKQILLVLLFTGLAAGGFVVTRSLTQPDKPKNSGLPEGMATRGAGNVQAPQAQRPAVTAPGEQTTEIGSALQAEIDRRQAFDWQSAAGQDTVVLPADAWRVDFSEVDFSSDVLFERDGLAVRRSEWQAFVAADLGSSLVDARLSRDLSLAYAERAGASGSFSDVEHEVMLRISAEARGQHVNTFLAESALEYRLPSAAIAYLRRMAVETVVGYMLSYAPGEAAPAALEMFMTNPENRDFTTTVSQSLHDAMAKLVQHRTESDEPNEDLLRRIGAAVDALTVAQTGARLQELAYRSWYRSDAELPEGAIAAIKTDDIENLMQSDAVRMPWELPGEASYVETTEIWEVVGSGLSRAEQERLLGDLLFYRVLERELTNVSALPSSESTWMQFIADHEAGQRAAFSMAFMHLQLEGFPSFARLREMRRVREGFERTLSQDWNSESNLREYFDENRFFIEHWSLQLALAVFPASDFSEPGALPDWNRAQAEAEAMVAAVRDGGSFDTLRDTHMRALTEEIKSSQGVAAADGFQNVYGGRVIRGSATHIDQMLDRSIYRDLVEGFSVPAAAAASLSPNGVSDAWRTDIGYVVVKLIDASVGGLENEFEDMLFGTEKFFKRQGFKSYANATLKGFLSGA